MSRPSGDAVLIARRIGEFLRDHAPRTLGRSPHTVRSYEGSISLYLPFLEAKGVTEKTLSRRHLERAWIEDWVGWLKSERGCSNDTCNVRLAGVRAFLEYLGTRDVSLRYLGLEAKGIKRQTADKARVDGMSRDAVEALLAAPGTSTAIGRRDTCFLTLAYSTACRLDEVRTLTVGQLRLDAAKPHMTVTGKGGKVRTCYLIPRVVIVRSYIRDELGPEPRHSDLLFPSSHGGGPMSEQAWDKRIKKHAAKARETCPDVPEAAHFHQLRTQQGIALAGQGQGRPQRHRGPAPARARAARHDDAVRRHRRGAAREGRAQHRGRVGVGRHEEVEAPGRDAEGLLRPAGPFVAPDGPK